MVTAQNPSTGFEREVRAAVQRLRHALAEILGQLGADVRRPQALADQLGVGGSLVWRATQVVADDDAFAAVQHLPGPAARRTLLQSFEVAGARPEAVRAVQEALANFDRVVEVHAGDRDTFSRMLVGLPGERQSQRDEAQRKLAFQGNSAIWGIEAKVRLSTQVLTPSANPQMLDLTAISGLVGLRWLRSDVPWPVFSRRYTAEDGSDLTMAGPEALDQSAEPDSPPLWRDFCAGNLPPIRKTLGHDGVARFELLGGEAGNSGLCTCINAWTDRAALPRWSVPTRRTGEHSVWFTTPVEVLIFDLFVHKSVSFAERPSVHIISHLPGGPGGDHRVSELPIADRIAELDGPFDLTTPELPVYPRMMSRVFDHLGREPAGYRAFRFRFGFPPIAARAQFRYRLSEER